ncbi:hypothetical protein WMF11_07465 [Sorangium sp. So ce295]|uniref:hypothetical protein n=1 Tax=Sorangium sp. So ce295 TaxID=3133295 RepID=UPI003F64609B
MKDPVIAIDAVSHILASTTLTNALPGARAVVLRRVARRLALCAEARSAALPRRPRRLAPRRIGADVERWTATRCRGAALAAL